MGRIEYLSGIPKIGDDFHSICSNLNTHRSDPVLLSFLISDGPY